MSGNLEWRFDPIPPSGAVTGGAAETFVFKPQLSAFIREVLQNSHDQRLPGQAANVAFRLHRISAGTPMRRRVEDRMGWGAIDEHLAAVATGEDTMGLRINRARSDHAQRPLIALEISDERTRGLVGGEQTRGENFAGLCRHVLDTPPGQKPGRGGSYGLGKAVLWLYSSFSTIMFYSRLSEPNPQGTTRFIGRTVLPYHEVGTKKFAGLGWLGAPTQTDGGEYAASIWDEHADATAAELGIDRKGMGTGTSILVVGFREPYLDEDRDLEAVARDIVEHATRWFWPAIMADVPSLEVTASVVRDGAEGDVHRAAATREVEGFIAARSAADVKVTAPTSGDVAERIIPFTVPALRNPRAGQPQGEVAAQVRLRVHRGDDGNAEHANSIALMRGAGMVVDYAENWARPPGDGNPYFAVLEAGRARGMTPQDDAVEEFLRAAEPPAHDEWLLTDAAKERYIGGIRSRLERLRLDVAKAVAEICEETPPSGQDGPELLARLFPLGDGGRRPKPDAPRFDDMASGHVREGCWVVTGTVSRIRGEGEWIANIALKLDVDSGRPTPVALAACDAMTDGVTVVVADRQESATIALPSHINSFTYTATTVELDAELLRTRIVVDVRSRLLRADDSGGDPS